MSERFQRLRLGRAGAFALVATLAAAPAAHGQTWRSVTSARQLWGSEPVTVEVEYGMGELQIGTADQGMLYRMELRYDEETTTPLAEFDSASRRLTLGGKSTGTRGRFREGSSARISLSNRVPLDLGLHFGAGEADLELGGLRLRRVDIETGASQSTIRFGTPNPIQADVVEISAGAAELKVIGIGNARTRSFQFQGGVGETTLDFSGAWDGNASASIKMGMGAVTLRFPRSMGVRISRSSFLTSFDDEGLVKRGDAYFSENWESARHQLTLDVEAALGSIDIEWIN